MGAMLEGCNARWIRCYMDVMLDGCYMGAMLDGCNARRMRGSGRRRRRRRRGEHGLGILK